MALTNPGSLINVAELDYFRRKALVYEDVYIGVATSLNTVLDEDYHHDLVEKGKPLAFSTVTGYIWLILPASYTPMVTMSFVEAPMNLDSTTVIEGKSYKIWRSPNTMSGSFNLSLF